MRNQYLRLTTLVLAFAISACAIKEETTTGSTRRSSLPEASNCSSQSISNPVTLTGAGAFEVWDVTAVGLATNSTKNIRFAEVRIKNASGTIIQCGETDASGLYSLQIEKPSASQIYTVEINSRSYGNMVKASVLNNIYDNEFYTISTTATVLPTDSVVTVNTMTATYDGNVYGGAFNVLDQIYRVNQFLRDNTGACGICETFTVAPKVNIYWTPGFNPVAYFSPEDVETLVISFLDPTGDISGTPALYLLGGVGGDVNNTDTDHFDNSVILHEYGHFLELTFSKSDSQGGSHNGNFIIDPRLAWSEGFSNYVPSVVMGTNVYRDSFGNADGNSGAQLNFSINLETPVSNANPIYNQDIVQTWSPVGEGIFRELVIARALYDLTDGVADSYNSKTDNANFNFSYIWEAYSDSTNGINKTSLKFISAPDFYAAFHSNLILEFGSGSAQVTSFNDILSMESQRKDKTDWGLILNSSSTSCGTRTIDPGPNLTKPGDSSAYPNIFLSSDFFQYYHAGGPLQISINYTKHSGAATDLDLVVYTTNFILFDSDSVLAMSAKYPNQESPAGTETASIFNAPAGYYMVQIYSAETSTTSATAGADYTLKVGSNFLCP